jgi:hypothetical protein
MLNVPRVSEAQIPRLHHSTRVHRVNLAHEKNHSHVSRFVLTESCISLHIDRTNFTSCSATLLAAPPHG